MADDGADFFNMQSTCPYCGALYGTICVMCRPDLMSPQEKARRLAAMAPELERRRMSAMAEDHATVDNYRELRDKVRRTPPEVELENHRAAQQLWDEHQSKCAEALARSDQPGDVAPI